MLRLSVVLRVKPLHCLSQGKIKSRKFEVLQLKNKASCCVGLKGRQLLRELCAGDVWLAGGGRQPWSVVRRVVEALLRSVGRLKRLAATSDRIKQCVEHRDRE